MVIFRSRSLGSVLGGHDSRNGTAKSNQHRYNASAGQTDFSEQFVHKESNAGNVSAVFH